MGEERPHLPLRQVRRTCRCVSAFSWRPGGGGGSPTVGLSAVLCGSWSALVLQLEMGCPGLGSLGADLGGSRPGAIGHVIIECQH